MVVGFVDGYDMDGMQRMETIEEEEWVLRKWPIV